MPGARSRNCLNDDRSSQRLLSLELIMMQSRDRVTVSTLAKQAVCAATIATSLLLLTYAVAGDYQTCDYNGKVIRCRRDWSGKTMKVTWEDGIIDSYRLIHRTTNTSAEWKDSRGGTWDSLMYAGSMILINSSNKNTIIFDGTRKMCLNEWRLGGICVGNP